MNTATDDERERRYLMDTPQRLGFLPTRWFWKDRENRRLVGWAFALVSVATMLLAELVGVNYLVAAASLLLTLPLTEGLLEKYVRRQLAKRQRALIAGETVDSSRGLDGHQGPELTELGDLSDP